MKHFKMRMMQSKAPTVYTKSLSQGYGIDLSANNGLYKLGIHGASQTEAPSGQPASLSFLGDPTTDGRYEFPLHCHGENMLGGEEFSAAFLDAAGKNSYITASVENGILSFTSRTNQVLLPSGRLRGANKEVFTIMFKFSAPENTGSMTSTGLGFSLNSGMQTIAYNKTYNGEVVQVQTNSNAARQLLNLMIATSTGKPRTIELSTFGVFRGAVNNVTFSPYWGEKTSFFLSEPLRSLLQTEDIAYPMQGHAIRNVRSMDYRPTSVEAIQLGSVYPTYILPLPEALWEKELLLDRFTYTTSESDLIANAFWYMRASDGKSLLVTASEEYNTPASFLNFFNALSVHIAYKATDPVIEHFTPITITTRAGRNHIDLMTEVLPGMIDFTYV